MAWLATDNAESYSNGNSISGLNGGSDWSAAWSVAGSGTKDIINTPTLQGSLCFRLDKVGSVEPEAIRTFANTTSGSVTFIARATTNSEHSILFGFDESTTLKFSVALDGGNNLGGGTGKITAYNGSGTSLQAFSADTNYTIIIEYDNSTDQFRVKVDSGSFSSWINYASVATNITRIRFRVVASNANNADFYFDDIKPYVTVITQTCSDALSGATDSVVRATTRTISETTTNTDVVTTVKVQTKTISDALSGVTDSVLRTSGKVILDTVAMTDSVVRSVSKTIADALSMAASDVVTLTKVSLVTLQDALSMAASDVVVTASTLARTISDALSGVTDSISIRSLWAPRSKPTSIWTPRSKS